MASHTGYLVRTSAAVVVSLMLATGCTTSKTSLKGKKFEPFTAKGLHFKVNMPGTPNDKSSTSMVTGGKSNRFVCEDDEIAYGVSEDPLPGLSASRLSNPLALQGGLDGACSGAVKGIKGTETKRLSVVLGGGRFPGREIEGTVTEPAKGKFRYRFYIDPQTARMYSVGVVGIPSRVDAPEVDSFLSSLTLF